MMAMMMRAENSNKTFPRHSMKQVNLDTADNPIHLGRQRVIAALPYVSRS